MYNTFVEHGVFGFKLLIHWFILPIFLEKFHYFLGVNIDLFFYFFFISSKEKIHKTRAQILKFHEHIHQIYTNKVQQV